MRIGHRGARLGPIHPGARVLGPGEPVGEVRDAGHRQVLDGAGGRLAGRRGDRRRSPRGDDQPGGADGLRRANHRPQVAGVLDLVQGDDQGVRTIEQRVRIGVGIWVHLGDYPLVVGRARQPSELRRRHLGGGPDAANAPPAVMICFGPSQRSNCRTLSE